MGSEALDPIAFPEAWDHVTIAGRLSPGVCKLSGFKRAFGWDVKKGKGVKGSTATLNEYPPAEGTIEFQFWTREHFEEWRKFRSLFMYDATKKTVSAVDILHPALDDIGCTRVVCKDISAIEHAGGGLYKVTVSLLEYNPPPKKSAVSTPKSSKDNAGSLPGANPPDPDADLLARMEELRKEAQKP